MSVLEIEQKELHEEIREGFAEMRRKFVEHDEQLEFLATHALTMDHRLNRIETKIDTMDSNIRMILSALHIS